MSTFVLRKLTFCTKAKEGLDFRLQTSDYRLQTGAWPAHRPVGLGLQMFGLITLRLVINYVLLLWAEKSRLELKVLERSVRRVSHACNFQDLWKWKSAKPTTIRKAGYAPDRLQTRLTKVWTLDFWFLTSDAILTCCYVSFSRSHVLVRFF